MEVYVNSRMECPFIAPLVVKEIKKNNNNAYIAVYTLNPHQRKRPTVFCRSFFRYFDIKIHLMSLSSPFKSEKCWQVFTIRVQS